jgi:hypothetical protein
MLLLDVSFEAFRTEPSISPKGPERQAKLILAMIVARVIEPAAKLATARQLSETTAAHSLGAPCSAYPDQLRRGERYRPRPSQGGQFWTPIGGHFSTPIDSPGNAYPATSIAFCARSNARRRRNPPKSFSAINRDLSPTGC